MVREIYHLDTDRQTAGQTDRAGWKGSFLLATLSRDLIRHLCCQYKLKLDKQIAKQAHNSVLTADRESTRFIYVTSRLLTNHRSSLSCLNLSPESSNLGEDNWGATWIKEVADCGYESQTHGYEQALRWPHNLLLERNTAVWQARGPSGPSCHPVYFTIKPIK